MATSVHEAGPRRIGRYELVHHLATGGMAEIYVAKLAGIGGFQRHVTLKTIRPERAEDQAFVHMFLDEARLVAALHHHNVAQVHDVGIDNGTYYLALEYVHGESARAILERARDLNITIPLEISLGIVAAAAAGLHHAHECRSENSVPLGIVHRDVSPSNILIGYDGSVKLIDFGIARAVIGRHTETQTGMIKGKFGYMSPEQCRGWAVDRRSDVFGLGIVLYELTTQTRAFRAENDYETMQRIVRGDIARPSRVSPGFPLDLELVVLRALSVDPDARFPNASSMLEMVERCARRVGGLASPATIGRFLTDLFGARVEPWREEDDRTNDDASVEEIELVEAFDGSSLHSAVQFALGDGSESTGGRTPITGRQSASSIEADVVTVTASVPLPGMPAPLSPMALHAMAAGDDEDTGRPRSRLASGTQPLPMGDNLAFPQSSPGWTLAPGVVDMSMRRDSSGHASTMIVPPLHVALASALRQRWVWIGLGAAFGILLGVGVGIALAPTAPARAAVAPAAPVANSAPAANGATAPAAPAANSAHGSAAGALSRPAAPARGEPRPLAPEVGEAVVDRAAIPDEPEGDDEPVHAAPSAPPREAFGAPSSGTPAAPSSGTPSASPERVLVRITSEPDKATVLLDGHRLGKTPFVGSLRHGAGAGVIKLRRRGFKTVKVDVNRDQDIRLHVELPELGR